jgi:hypothetical protein
LDAVALFEGVKCWSWRRSSVVEDLGTPSNVGVPHSHVTFGGLNSSTEGVGRSLREYDDEKGGESPV